MRSTYNNTFFFVFLIHDRENDGKDDLTMTKSDSDWRERKKIFFFVVLVGI